MLTKYTYKTNASLYLGLQLPDLLFVDCFLFLSASLGPMRFTSTNGRNIPVVGHTSVLAATTVIQFYKQNYSTIVNTKKTYNMKNKALQNMYQNNAGYQY